MIGLTGEVCTQVVILAAGLEGVVAQVAPQEAAHAQFVGFFKHLGDVHDLVGCVFATKVDGGTHCACPKVPRFADAAEWNLARSIWVGEQFVVIQLHHERNAMRILAAHACKHAKGAGHCVAATLHCELHDVLAIKVSGVLGKARTSGMLNPLIDRQNAHVPGSTQAPVPIDPLQTAHDLRATVRLREAPVHKVRPRKVQGGLGDLRSMRKKTISLSAQRLYHVNSEICHRARNGTPKMVPVLPFLPDQFIRLASLYAMSPGIQHGLLGIDETAHKFAAREGAFTRNRGEWRKSNIHLDIYRFYGIIRCRTIGTLNSQTSLSGGGTRLANQRRSP